MLRPLALPLLTFVLTVQEPLLGIVKGRATSHSNFRKAAPPAKRARSRESSCIVVSEAVVAAEAVTRNSEQIPCSTLSTKWPCLAGGRMRPARWAADPARPTRSGPSTACCYGCLLMLSRQRALLAAPVTDICFHTAQSLQISSRAQTTVDVAEAVPAKHDAKG